MMANAAGRKGGGWKKSNSLPQCGIAERFDQDRTEHGKTNRITLAPADDYHLQSHDRARRAAARIRKMSASRSAPAESRWRRRGRATAVERAMPPPAG